MASSNRHWPSMFKSKPYNSHHPWQQPDINSTPLCQRAPYASGSIEERSPDPKPRWNPKPEQIRILEAIFNSGMVNPPRDEIRRIRVQLQEYGQVGDANVFYWFQNRKSRSKHKQRHGHNSKTQSHSPTPAFAGVVLPSSSSSSSEKSPPEGSATSSVTTAATTTTTMSNKLFNSPSGCVNHTYLPASHGDFLSDPFFYQMQQQPATLTTTNLFPQGLCLPEFSSNNIVQVPVSDQVIAPCTGFLFGELLNQTTNPSKKTEQEQEKMKLGQLGQQQLPPLSYNIATSGVANTIVQGGGMEIAGGAAKSTVFINNMAVDVANGPFNVRAAFGDEAVLIHSTTGQPLLTNQWGVTLQSLQPGNFYYLV